MPLSIPPSLITRVPTSQRERHTTHGLPHPAQGHTVFHLRLREEPHTHLMGTPNSWASSPHTTAHNIPVPSPSQRGTKHPTHGLPHKPTHSICVLEDVSRNCNHQQKLVSMFMSLRARYETSYPTLKLVSMVMS
jgi:hypothetical protein